MFGHFAVACTIVSFASGNPIKAVYDLAVETAFRGVEPGYPDGKVLIHRTGAEHGFSRLYAHIPNRPVGLGVALQSDEPEIDGAASQTELSTYMSVPNAVPGIAASALHARQSGYFVCTA